MEELKRCACGQVPMLRTYRTYNEKIHGMGMKYYVECNCGAQIPELGYEEKEKAIAEWNEVIN